MFIFPLESRLILPPPDSRTTFNTFCSFCSAVKDEEEDEDCPGVEHEIHPHIKITGTVPKVESGLP